MRTTVDLADTLCAQLRTLADSRGATFRALLEEAVRTYLAAQERPAPPFRLELHTFRGEGLAPGVSEGDWATIRARGIL